MLNELEFVRSQHKRQENQPAKPCSAFDTFCSFVGLEAHISPRKISQSGFTTHRALSGAGCYFLTFSC